MKKLFFLAILCFNSILFAQIVNIPDINFKNALLSHNPVIDANADNEIQVAEAESFTGAMDIYNKNIGDLTGIGSFINLIELNCGVNNLNSLDITNNTKLEVLRFIHNNILNIDLSQTPLLEEIEINFNPLSSIDVSNNIALKLFLASYCSNLTSVDLSNNINLENIFLNSSPIQSLDVSNNLSLKVLGVIDCGLAGLNLTQNLALTNALLQDNEISVLDVSNNIALRYLLVEGNPMVGIDFSNNPEMFSFTAGSPELEHINAKNGNNSNIVNFEVTNSSNLSIICVDNVAYAETNFVNIPSGTQFTEDCSLLIQNNLISGVVLFDFDNNGCSVGDYSVDSILIQTTDGSTTINSVTDQNGMYDVIVGEGIYTTTIILESLPNNFNATPASVETVFNTFGNSEQVDFCLSSTQVFDDLKISLLSIDDARPGFDSNYRIVYENLGTKAVNGNVTMQFDDLRQHFLESSPVQDNISSNLITWNYIDLLPFESRVIDITFNNFPPPINEADDVLRFEIVINPIQEDVNPDDNTYVLEQIMVNSQDPNDKIVNQGEEIFQAEVGGYLDYMVRFQNVGSASAVNVKIDDILSGDLNWNTFRILSASHGYSVEIIDANQISFIFEDINLPSANSDPEGSQGYIAFQVRTDETLQIGDSVENSANIFFDFNAPIITNTVVTTVVENLSISGNDIEQAITLYPNPVSEQLHIIVSEGILFESAIVYSILGEQVLSISEKKINLSNLSEGIYFIKIKTDEGSVTKKIIKE